MSHLIVEKGKEVGREVVVPSAGMKFGRSPANDLMLDDDGVMPFHGRFFFKSDGSLWVTDFGAGERIQIGGREVHEQALQQGDLVTVSSYAFRVIGTELVDDAALEKAAPLKTQTKKASEDAGEAEVDLGFKHKHKSSSSTSGSRKAAAKKGTEKSSSLASRLFQVLLIVLLVVVGIFVGPEVLKMTKKTNAASSAAPLFGDKERLVYEHVEGNIQNVFRFYAELDQEGVLMVRIDDLNHDRHISRRKELSEAARLQLFSGIQDAGFFDVEMDLVGEVPNRYDLLDIAVINVDRVHQVKVLNRTLPIELRRAKEQIEDFVKSELGIAFTWNMTTEELSAMAKDAFKNATSRFMERDVRYSNLPDAISLYEEALLYMETMEPKPKLFKSVNVALETAIEEQDKQYEDYMFQAERAIRLRNWKEAARCLRILTELVPDREDERNAKVKSKLLTVERNLK